MVRSWLRVLWVVGLVACGSPNLDPTSTAEQAVYTCSDPGQRFTCEEPCDPNRRFVCHATGSHHNRYVKISVPINSHAHVPGVPHNPNKPADQAPGASGNDLGGGIGLDCECNERICEGVCTGAEDGASCDDGDKCTGDGSCDGDACEPGAPSCTPGAPVDACNVQSGACDAATGACGIDPLPAGTTCGVEHACDGSGTCVAHPIVVVNEVESNGGVPGDWVELYNAGIGPADVSGWRFLDADNTHTAYVIPAGTTIPAGGFLVLEEAQFGFGLGGADSARLFDAANAPVETFAWTSHALTTYGRCPDGTGAFVTNTSSTKGTANDCTVTVKINEVESNGGVPGDWVELFNPGPIPVDVSGWRFLDADNTHTAYVIPAGTTIAVGGYYLVEEAQFGFGLGAADSARLFDAANAPVETFAWTSHAVTTYGRCPNGSGAFRTTTSSTKGTANDCAIPIAINEIESSGGVPGDWVELFNNGPIAVDLSGWVFKDSDDTHAYVIPAGTTLAAGAYYLLEEAAFGFGLGAADSARVFDATNQVIDSFSWTAHAATTYSRCPNGTGAFATSVAVTKGAANSCTGGPPPVTQWPGANTVTTVDGTAVFGGNLSGVFYEAALPNVLWAVRNGPSTLFRLIFDGSIWTPDPGDWSAGKTLRYPDGTGSPDGEDVARAEPSSSAIYVATERDNDVSAVSRLSILRFDTAAAGAELVATHEWNLNADLPAVGANTGLEAIAWIPDSALVASAFFDEQAGHTYNPAEYPNHGTGVFFVGLEANGTIYAYALDHVGGGFTRLATFVTGDVTVKALAYDRETNYLWSTCGSACANQTSILVIDTTPGPSAGRLVLRRRFASPTTMPNIANEGIAIAPESQCIGGMKPFYWSDDSETGGHSLRADTIPCGAFAP